MFQLYDETVAPVTWASSMTEPPRSALVDAREEDDAVVDVEYVEREVRKRSPGLARRRCS